MNMSDVNDTIIVALSSTGFIVNFNDPKIKPFLENQIAVCSTKHFIQTNLLLNFNFLSKTLHELSKTIFINEKKSNIIIGINEQDYLINYTANPRNQFEDEFFKKWNEKKQLLFEFSVIQNFKTCLSIRGHWINNKWKFLETIKGETIEIFKLKNNIGQ